MIQVALSWLYNLEGWQLTGLMLVLFIIAVPIIFSVFQFLWSKVPERKKRDVKKVKAVDEFWGLSRAADAFFRDLGNKLNTRRFAQRDSLYIVLTNDPNNFAKSLSISNLEARLKKGYSSGSVHWVSYLFGSLSIVAPKIWNNDSKYIEGLIRLISRYRPERPLDGVIIDVSAQDILSSDGDFVSKYKKLKQALTDIQNRSQMTLPVYYLLSDIQTIPGIEKVFHPEQALKSTLGVFAASQADVFSSSGRIRSALGSVSEAVDAIALSALSENSKLDGDINEVVQFPRLFSAALDGMADIVEETFPFNSFEFTGELRSVAISGSSVDFVSKQPRDFFFTSLFEKIVSGEQNLAKPLPSELMSMSAAAEKAKRRMWIVGAFAATVAFVQIVYANSILNKSILHSKEVLSSFSDDIETFENVNLGSNAYNAKISHNLSVLLKYNPASSRSLWLPSSLWSTTFAKMNEAQAALDKFYLFTPLHDGLQKKLNSFLLETPSPANIAKITLPYPNFDILNDSLLKTKKIEELVSIYRQIREGNFSRTQLNHITSEILGFNLHFSYFPALNGANLYASLPIIPQMKLDQLPVNFEQASESFILDLVGRDGILEKSRRLSLLLSGEPSELDVGKDAYSAVKEIQILATDLERLFLDGRYDWLASESLFENPQFEVILEALKNDKNLQISTAQQLQKNLFSARRELISNLTRFQLPNGERMYVIGQERPTLNNDLIEMRQFLDQALGLALSNVFSERSPRDKSLDNLELQLRKLVGARFLVAELKAWSAELSKLHRLDFSFAPVKNVQIALDKVVSESARSLSFEFVSAIRSQLEAENMNVLDELFSLSDEFNESYDSLRNISFYLHELGHVESAKIVDEVIWHAAFEIIDRTHSVLVSGRAYNYNTLAFDNWTPEKSMSNALFGTNDSDSLDLYLIKNISFLERVLVEKGEKAISYINARGNFRSPEEVQKFNLVAGSFDAVKAYVLEDPSSSVDQLHKFIKSELPKMNFGTCGLPEVVDASSSSDFFLMKMRDIKDLINTSCTEVIERNGLGATKQFILMFEEKFSGKFPFSNSPAATGLTKKDALELISRFRVFERSGNLQWIEANNRGSIQYKFFKDLEKSVNFLSLLFSDHKLEDYVKPQIAVKFRTHRHAEELAKYVSLWEIKISDEQLSHYTEKNIIDWTESDEIKIRLKWAVNSLVKPKNGYTDGSYMNARGDTIEIKITSDWSFLRLIQAYSTDEFCEGKWSCVEINAPVEFISKSNRVLRGGKFKGFIDFKLLIGSREIEIPHFPRAAADLVDHYEQWQRK